MVNCLWSRGQRLWVTYKACQGLVEIPPNPFYLLNVGEVEGKSTFF